MLHDANEFIIRDGVFIRDFEGMYQQFDDPWDQQRNCGSDILLRSSYWFIGEVLRVGPHKLSHILDLGCGTGHCAKSLLSLGGMKHIIRVLTSVRQRSPAHPSMYTKVGLN